MTSWKEPRGGISKDSVDSHHGHLHAEAAAMATAASIDLLQDIRAAAGDADFLQYGEEITSCSVLMDLRTIPNIFEIVRNKYWLKNNVWSCFTKSFTKNEVFIYF